MPFLSSNSWEKHRGVKVHPCLPDTVQTLGIMCSIGRFRSWSIRLNIYIRLHEGSNYPKIFILHFMGN